ncbi:hypothetical protein CKN61_03190 [Carnobacterium divergens]|uniref:hypothetical protein n=1 Tax=Carnobacterium divergens TaxID=2748 RepID=UPI0010737A42|nr:hypothetical protein [Carnobacterium divergens]TFI93064.1 hypothetical protein CKN61_03190 [Carnobacterium divergens]
MNTSDWLNLLVAIVAIVVSLISLKQSEKSIKLTEKSIEDSNRPYLACYLSFVDVGYFQKYLVIKNFGTTPATIVNIDLSNNSTNIGVGLGFDSLSQTVIAPNQKFVTTFDGKSDDPIVLSINYLDMNGNLSSSSFNLNTKFATNLSYTRQSSPKLSAAENDLRHSLHAMAKNNL